MIQLISKLPFTVLYLFADFLYFMLYYVLGYRKKIVSTNLKKAFPDKSPKEIKAIKKGFYRNFADVMVEIIKTFDISKEDFMKRVTLKDKRIMDAYISQGHSIIALASHQCNWEWLYLGCCAHFTFPMAGIYKPIASPYFEKLVLEMRTKFGGDQVPMEKTLLEVKKRRHQPTAYGLMADQVPIRQHQKFWTEFLHQDTAFFVGAEKITQLFQYPAVFFQMKRVKRGHYEIRVQKLTEPPYEKGSHDLIVQYAKSVERLIMERPSDWLWSHKRWKYPKHLCL